MTRSIRIGNAQAFWGDRNDAAAEMLSYQPDLDYLTLDYLAELSMSILARQQEQDPDAGYARDFVAVVLSLVPYWTAGGRCRLLTNAGGLNPGGCAEACRAILEANQCRSLRLGIAGGDDIVHLLRSESAASDLFRNLDTCSPLNDVRQRLVTANAYLGAAPIVPLLADKADIVITGRVADPSLTVAACMHHFGWTQEDHDRLAGATVAGHLIECGTQVTGGISTDWLEVPHLDRIGFPVVEVYEDGTCIVTKPAGTGGCVTERTVKEQLLYEIGDPANYLSPDVTVSFAELRIDDLGGDRVRVAGAKGKPAPPTYKVSATYRDGYRAAGTLTILGRDAELKAVRCGEVIFQRVRDAGFQLRDTLVECLGSGRGRGAWVPAKRPVRDDQPSDRQLPPQVETVPSPTETVLRVAVESESFEAAERFTYELVPLITSGPQGTTGYAEGRPRVRPVYRHWPCLIARDQVDARTEMLVTNPPAGTRAGTPAGQDRVGARPFDWPRAPGRRITASLCEPTMPAKRQLLSSTEPEAPATLYDLAYARSGDKGMNANIGVIARRPESWAFLADWLSARRVEEFFASLGERLTLPISPWSACYAIIDSIRSGRAPTKCFCRSWH